MKGVARFMRRFTKALLCLMLAIGLALAGVYAWISIASPSLGFLRPAVVEKLNHVAPAWRLKVADIRLAWPAYRLLPVAALNGIEIAEADGSRRLTIGEIHLRFHWRGLLNRHFEPERIFLVRPELDFRDTGRKASGTSSRNVGGDASGPGTDDVKAFPRFRDVLTAAAGRLAAVPYLRRVRISEGAVLLKTGRFPVPKASLDISRSERATRLHLAAEIGEPELRTRFVADLAIPSDDAPASVDARMDGYPHRLAALWTPELGVLDAGRFRLRTHLTITIPEKKAPQCDRFEIESDPGLLSAPSVWQKPIPIQTIDISGAVQADPMRIRMDAISIVADGIQVTGAGGVGDLSGFSDLFLDLRIPSLDISKAPSLWPVRVVPDVRVWIRDHFKGGWIHDGRFRISLSPETLAASVLPKNAIRAVAPFRDLDLAYYSPMAPARDLAGVGVFTAHDIRIGVNAGQTYSGTDIASGRVVITGLTEPVSEIDIKAETAGPADDLRQAIFDLTGAPEGLLSAPAGRAETRLSFHFPLVDDPEDRFHYNADSRITDCRIIDQWGNRMDQDRLHISLADHRLTFDGEQGAITNPDRFEQPIPVEIFQGEARISESPPGLTDITAQLSVGGANFHVSGIAKLPMTTPYIDLNVHAETLPFDTVYSLWPTTSGALARKWLQTHIAAPLELKNANLRLNLEPEMFQKPGIPKRAVEAHAEFQNAKVSLDPPLPPLSAATGAFTLDAGGVRVILESGKISNSRLVKGTVDLSGLADASGELLLKADFDGPLADLLSLSGSVGMNLPFPVETITEGRARTTLRLGLPRSTGVPEIALRSDIENLQIANLSGVPIKDGQLHIEIADNDVAMKGQAFLGNNRLNIECRSRPSGGMEMEIGTALRIADFQGIGFSDPSFLDGEIPIQARIRFGGGNTDIKLYADCGRLSVNIPGKGWTQRQSALELEGIFEPPKTIRIGHVALRGNNLAAEGNGFVRWGVDPELRLDLSKYLMDQTDLSTTVSYRSGGNLDIRLAGKTLDLAPFWESPQKQRMPRSEPSTPSETIPGKKRDSTFAAMDVTADIDTVLMAKKERLNHLRASVQIRSGTIRSAQILGEWDSDKQLEMRLTPKGNGLDLALKSDDAGRFLESIGLSEHVGDGTMNANARFDGPKLLDTPFRGKLVLEKFTLHRMPVLVSILSMASFVGILEQLQSGGIDFSRLDMALSYNKGVLKIEEGRMEGISLGMTTQGTWDFNARQIALEGVVVPFNMVNTMIKVIPVFGKMLVGDGIIATNYSLKGASEDPVVSIQPLSMLSPGFVRSFFGKIFEEMTPDRQTENRDATVDRPAKRKEQQ